MCRYCVEFGKGTKWYLNPDNYRPELFENPLHRKTMLALSGAEKNSYEIGRLGYSERALPDYNFPEVIHQAHENSMAHGGQTVPLEDVLKIIDLAPGDRFYLTHCACRRYFGRNDFVSCMFFDPVVDRAIQDRPWETDSKVITKEEAKQFQTEVDKIGLVHSVWDAGVDSDGKPPIVICACHESDCVGARLRAHYGVVNAFRKGEYVAQVDRAACAEGCKKNPACLPRCTFGAMTYNPLENIVSININRCFGCGLCRNNCPKNAIKLVDRTEFPALVDVW